MDELEQSYQKMEEHFLSSRSSRYENDKPQLIFVFASPGAGKSSNIKPILNWQLRPKTIVNLEIDELKTFIPYGANIDKTANDWFLRLVDRAIEQRRSIVIFRQRNMLQLKQTFNIYKKAQNAGYLTQATFLALDKERSRLGMIHRYEFALDNTLGGNEIDRENYPRRPKFLSHYIFYKALPVMLNVCSLSKTVDIVNVYDRNGVRLAYEDKKTGQRSSLSASQALRHERNRVWSPNEISRFNRRRDEAETKMKEHGRSFFEKLKFHFLTATPKNK